MIRGYWIVSNSSVLLEDSDEIGSLTIALGFSPTLEAAKASREEIMDSLQVEAFVVRSGRYLQTEAPVDLPDPAAPYLLGSLSLAQLVNLYSSEPVKSFAGIMALDAAPGFGLETIEIRPPEPGTRVNWLTLFYALEWALFAGFAVFLWWRLVEDERIRESQ